MIAAIVALTFAMLVIVGGLALLAWGDRRETTHAHDEDAPCNNRCKQPTEQDTDR